MLRDGILYFMFILTLFFKTHMICIYIWKGRKAQKTTRIWTWRGPRWSPTASYGRSSGAHLSPSAKLVRPPGTGGTANSTTPTNGSIVRIHYIIHKQNKQSDDPILIETSIPCMSPFSTVRILSPVFLGGREAYVGFFVKEGRGIRNPSYYGLGKLV